MDKKSLDQILSTAVRSAIGWSDQPGSDLSIEKPDGSPLQISIAEAFETFLDTSKKTTGEVSNKLKPLFEKMRSAFHQFYGSRMSQLEPLWEAFQLSSSIEDRAKVLTHLFLPELNQPDADLVEKWKLKNVSPNPVPIKPTEVLIQLNGLYTTPEKIPGSLPDFLKKAWDDIREQDTAKLADYDHPVSIFEDDRHHELLSCLAELDKDMSYEINRGVLPDNYKFPVLISVSVTHRHIDSLCGKWIEWLLKENHYTHLKCLVLTEEKVMKIKKAFPGLDRPVFTVLGKYAAHFNALKYCQLLFENAFGIRAGFKLDTDEGIRSEDLHKATELTWLQTMCHNLWGGAADNAKSRPYYLGVNEGEYINKKDIENLGYKGALRTPDVSVPATLAGPEIFFNKGLAHGRCTALYNQFNNLSDHISHPVVKGGGYGITNEGLRRFTPFTFSKVGRAEDQQFYICAMAGGCRGIFHPDLRIAHYKSSGGAAALSEEKTIATRFIGDMYRLIIFSHLVKILPELYGRGTQDDLKWEIDPMPGAFTGDLCLLQAFLTLLYKAYAFCHQGKESLAQILLTEGIDELIKLVGEIESGKIADQVTNESRQWKDFVSATGDLDPEKVRELLDSFAI